MSKKGIYGCYLACETEWISRIYAYKKIIKLIPLQAKKDGEYPFKNLHHSATTDLLGLKKIKKSSTAHYLLIQLNDIYMIKVGFYTMM